MAKKIEMYLDEMIERIRKTLTLSPGVRDSRLQQIYKDVCIHCKIEGVGVPPEIEKEIKKVSTDIDLEVPTLPAVPYNSYSILPWVKKRQKEENEEYIDFCLYLDKIDDPKLLIDQYVKMLEDGIRLKQKPTPRLLIAVTQRYREINKWKSHIALGSIDYERGINNVIEQLKDKLAYIEFIKKNEKYLYPYEGCPLVINDKNRERIEQEIKNLKKLGKWRTDRGFCKWLERMQKELGPKPEVSATKSSTISVSEYRNKKIHDHIMDEYGKK